MFAQNLRSASMAGVPAVAVTTTEWERIVEDIRYVAANVNQNMMLWNHIDGLMDERGESVVGPADVIGTLEYIQQTEDTFVVFLNFNVSLKSPAVIQKVREAANVIKTTGSTMVFVSASGSIPPELEKEIILLDYDLPDKAGIAEVVSSLVEVNPADESVEALINAAVGLTKNEAENVIALALAKNDRLITEKTIEDVKRQKAQALKKSGVLELYEPENLPKVGGLDVLKLWLWERGKAFSPEAREFGLPFPKGILVFGIPGTGKSLIAKTIAKQWNMPLLVMQNVLDKYVGESEKRMKEALKQAEAMAPCVLFIDEIEKFFAGVGGTGDSGVSSRIFGQFLSWMQESKAPVFTVATANNIAAMPPELMRKGRFDELFFVDLPGSKEREEIFKIHLTHKGRDANNFDLKQLTDATPGYTGSEIEQIVIAGLYRAFAKGQDITTKILLEVAKETPPLSVTMEEVIQDMREWGNKRARAASSFAEEPEKKLSAFKVARKIRG
jgi:SpoVK/Ycf46/Vps4 family AAA+-type ATPase